MDSDVILRAAFALRDREGLPSPAAIGLREILPASFDAIAVADRDALSRRAMIEISKDANDLAFFLSEAARVGVKTFAPVTPTLLEDIWICPKGDFRYTRPNASFVVPPCPTHGLALQAL